MKKFFLFLVAAVVAVSAAAFTQQQLKGITLPTPPEKGSQKAPAKVSEYASDPNYEGTQYFNIETAEFMVTDGATVEVSGNDIIMSTTSDNGGYVFIKAPACNWTDDIYNVSYTLTPKENQYHWILYGLTGYTGDSYSFNWADWYSDSSSLEYDVEFNLSSYSYSDYFISFYLEDTDSQYTLSDLELWGYNEVDYWYDVEVEAEGDFAQNLLTQCDRNWATPKCVRVSGPLNSTDFSNMKSLSNLKKIDLSKAEFDALPSYFMSGMSYLKEVTLPDNITELPYEAFYYSEKFEVLNSSPIKSVGDYAFQGTRISEFDFSEIESIGTSAFYSTQLTDEIQLPESLTSLGSNAFGWTPITSISFPTTITVLPYRICYYCQSLTDVSIPSEVTEIGNDAFRNCTSLKNITLPSSLVTLGSQAFYSTPIEEVSLPSKVTTIGNSAFSNCSNLKTVKCYSAQPPTLNGNLVSDFSYTNLYVPPFARADYRAASYWSNFIFFYDLEDPIDYIKITKPVTFEISADDADVLSKNPEIEITWTSTSASYIGQLTINGDGAFSAGNVSMMNQLNYYRSSGDYHTTLINNSEYMRANGVDVTMWFYPSYWHFISLPFDCKVSDLLVSDGAYWTIRKYDSQARADGDTDATWVTLAADETMTAGQGYIVHGLLDYNYFGIQFSTSAEATDKNNIFRSTDYIMTLDQYEAEFAQNRSWNLVGNPYPAYFDMHCTTNGSGEEFSTPITLWRGSSYSAYSPIDDDVVLQPFESFFIQCPLDNDQIIFSKDGRMHYTEAYNYSGTPGARIAATNLSRNVFNFNLAGSSELDNDRARIVINEDADIAYEVGRDAEKFFQGAESANLIYVVGDANYEICERPLDEGVATLGLRTAQDGVFTLSLTGRYDSDWQVWLTDNAAGKTVELTAEDYTFAASNGDDAARFSVTFSRGTQGINSLSSDSDQSVVVTNLSGVVVYRGALNEFKPAQLGVYLITSGRSTVKAFIK